MTTTLLRQHEVLLAADCSKLSQVILNGPSCQVSAAAASTYPVYARDAGAFKHTANANHLHFHLHYTTIVVQTEYAIHL